MTLFLQISDKCGTEFNLRSVIFKNLYLWWHAYGVYVSLDTAYSTCWVTWQLSSYSLASTYLSLLWDLSIYKLSLWNEDT